MQLTIDTSTDIASIAIIENKEALAELAWRCQENHTVELLPRLAQLLKDAGLDIQSADGIIVARGPGSYTGLRVGISVAKGLAFSLSIPVVGISTLEAEAYQYAETGFPVCPIFNAGRGEIAAAIYQKKRNRWQQLIAEHITDIETLLSQITARTIFCGELAPAIVDRLNQQLQRKAIIMPSTATSCRARSLVELGLKRLEAGDYDDPVALQPLYLRHPPITQPKRGLASFRVERAVIWDMDGVIIDTAEAHFRSWQVAFQKMGVKYTHDDFQRNFGQRNDTIIRNILGKDIPWDELDTISKDKEKDARDRMQQNIKPLPGVIELMNSLTEHGFKMALVSSSPPENIEMVIAGLDIKNRFQTIISGEEVTEGKPSPQGFLLAAQRLGVKPENCVVIEDAVAGVAAAKRAGMHCVAVTTTHPRQSLAEADLIVDTLEGLNANDFEKLIASIKGD